MTDIISAIPLALSSASAEAAAVFQLQDIAYDYAIGGMPFLSGINNERNMRRQLAPIRKEQFDNQQIPGEQSLTGWWLRSQSTFNGGAGLLYQDPSVDNQYATRYGTSVGLNPWTPGQISLLRSTSQRVADVSANTGMVMGWNDGTDRYWYAVGTSVTSDTGTATTAVDTSASTIQSLTSDGVRYIYANATEIRAGVGNAASAALYTHGGTNVVLGWAKGRLMAGIDNKIYELTTAGPALPAGDLRFTHLTSAWRWSAFAEGNSAIYAAGSAGSVSAIYKFTLSTAGAVPTLSSGGVVTSQLPLGEVVTSLFVYLGSFVGIGTNRGFRVGQIDGNGDISYGPLLVSTTSPVRGVAGYDRFMFFTATDAIDGASGLYRVDLGQPIQDNQVAGSVRFAYATDLQAHVTGACTSVTNLGGSDRMVFAVTGRGAYLEAAAALEPSGYLTTGRIRYNTQEPKLFKFISARTPVAFAGNLSVSVTDPSGSTVSIITISEGAAALVDNVYLGFPDEPVEWIQLRFDFTRSLLDSGTGMTLNGWQLKSLPGTVRQRIFEIPLLCFDRESDRTGQFHGYEGRTLDRLEAFEQIAQAGDTVLFQDLAQNRSYLVVIDEYEFRQAASPGPNLGGYGGYLFVQLRTVADVIA